MPKRTPTFKPKNHETRKEQNARIDKARNEDPVRKLYGSGRWRTLRVHILFRDPYCRRCLAKDPPIRTPSSTVNHIKKAKQNPELFWDPDNLEGVCSPCHSGEIQAEERKADG